MKNFGITGVAGYIAPRHLKAIKETGNNLVAALDPHDSVGILDHYFPDAAFFTEFERFDRHIDMLRRVKSSDKIDYLSICTPNFLHDAHIRLALRNEADAICEKPLVLNPWNLDRLAELEKETGKRVYTILQLRVHPALIKLKEELGLKGFDKKVKVEMTYITSRGPWYDFSWKGDKKKSGGVGTNIGIHFFDFLIWLFGQVENSVLIINEEKRMGGELVLKNADVKWFLSIMRSDLPAEAVAQGRTTHRSIRFDEKEIEFTEGFTDLHTRVYERILAGDGFGIEDVRSSVELAQKLRSS